jgi:hypothetical protein
MRAVSEDRSLVTSGPMRVEVGAVSEDRAVCAVAASRCE